MGALHSGHVALIDRARRECDEVVVTIFVNRLQFNDAHDFDNYPNKVESDLMVCRESGANAVYLPDHDSMYPPDFATTVSVSGVSDSLEGASRPGHFNGVSTVVTKLLIAAEADIAVFGQKDWQQVSVVRRLVTDLDLPTRVVVEPTVRDTDGLALSSRNTRLSPTGRSIASAIPRSLHLASEHAKHQPDSPRQIEESVHRYLVDAGLEVDYVSIVDSRTLTPAASASGSVLLLAVAVDGVRLIDNVEL